MKKPYFRPVVTQVELRPVEAALVACKTALDMWNAYDGEGWGCQLPLVKDCKQTAGS